MHGEIIRGLRRGCQEKHARVRSTDNICFCTGLVQAWYCCTGVVSTVELELYWSGTGVVTLYWCGGGVVVAWYNIST